jgi:hypothetical protein
MIARFFILVSIIIVTGCFDNISPTENSESLNHVQDTCNYYLKLPADLDLPTTPPFDTTFYRKEECKTLILNVASWGTSSSYTLISEDSNLTIERTVHIYAGERGCINITDLPKGTYIGRLMACGNGGSFRITLK